MAVVPPWYDKESKKQRRQTGVYAWGKTFRRVYTVASEDVDTLPTRGEVMNGETGLTAPRIVNWVFGKKTSGGIEIVVNWAQVVAYTDAAGTVASSTTLLELRGSRIPRNDGRYRYATRIYAATTAEQADNIPALYTNSTPTTDTGDRLARRKVSTVPNDSMVPGLWIIQANYHGFLTNELLHLKNYDANTATGPRGQRVFVEMSAGVESKCVALVKSNYPGVTPKMPCYSAKAQHRPFGIADVALVEARYGLRITAYQRKVGHARISARVVSKGTRKVLLDINDESKIIEGWDKDTFWQVVKGTNVVGVTTMFLRIETAAALGSFTLADALALQGNINSDPFELAIYGHVEPETFKCVSVELAASLQTDLMPLNYVIEVEMRGWNSLLKSQQNAYQLRTKKVFDSAGKVDTGETRPVQVLVPGKIDKNDKLVPAPVVPRDLYETVEFSRFMAGLLQWTL